MNTKTEETACNCGDGTECTCTCDCECCRSGKCTCGHSHEEKQQEAHKSPWSIAQSAVRTNDTVGAAFLGTLAILLLIFLVRSNKRNRELLLEVIELRKNN